MRKFHLSAVLMLVLLSAAQQVSYAQGNQTTVTIFIAYPSEARVTVDDQPRGKTPLRLVLPIGVHTFKFTKAGFPERVENLLVYDGGFDYHIYMEDKAPDSSLVSFLAQPDYAMWAANQDKLWFSSQKMYSYDPLNMTLTPAQTYPDVVTDPQLIAQLNPTTDIHASPSGRYLSYIAWKSPFSLTILDRQLNRSIEVELGAWALGLTNALEFLTRVSWSRNEQYGWIGSTPPFDAKYLVVENDTIRLISLTEFRNAEGRRITTDLAYSRPSEDGRVIVSGVIEGGREVVRLWMVDLHTLIGEPLPFANGDYWDAGFSEDGKQIMVARLRSLVRYDLRTQQSETISTVLGDLFEHYVLDVALSDSLRFAYIYSPNLRVAWVYRIPTVQQ